MERVVIDGRPYVLKHLDLAEDWTMRASGDLRGAPLTLWERGILDRLPDCLNQPIVAVAREPGTGPAPSGGCVLLMHDVSRWLVPATDEPVTLAQHLSFLRHMAALHAAFWDCGAECDVVPPCTATWSCPRGWDTPRRRSARITWCRNWSPRAGRCWPRSRRPPRRWSTPLAHDPGPLVQALAATPQTFVHSNWKLDNLGTDDAGRTVLLDWEQPGRGAALSDLAWYLAINCRRLPQDKQAAIGAYRDALEECGIDTAPWWERQLALCLLGALVQFGWEKALGGYDEELAWWESQAVAAQRFLCL